MLLHRQVWLRTCSIVQKRYQQVQAKPPSTKPLEGFGPGFRNVQCFPQRVAVRDKIASYTYANLYLSAQELSKEISRSLNGRTNERVMFMVPNDANYVITLWAIWMSGQIAVPLSPLHPKNILLYYANDTSAKLLITTPNFTELMQRVAKNTHTNLHVLDDKMKLHSTEKKSDNLADFQGGQSSSFYEKSDALILYTSGTTGNPKGVVLTHRNLDFQINTLIEAWKWSPNDTILHTLPLHHVHGTVNALLCPLQIGAKAVMLEKFNANSVWSYLLGITNTPEERKISVYMAVPTMYVKLIDEYSKVFEKDPKMVDYIKNTLKTKVRLMVSGSSPLPSPIYNKWLELSGHRLLERYGMTEIGMGLSNEYDSNREPGFVGVPLPGVSVRIAKKMEDGEDYKVLLECKNQNGKLSVGKMTQEENPSGDLLVSSPGVFKEYFNRPEATKKEFTKDGWFKTGDICEYSTEKNKFKMLGRSSVDIIKSGGYKISALDVETQLLSHPDIKECAVVGLPDEQFGEKVAAMIVLEKGKDITVESLREWGKGQMPKYWVPTVLKIAEALPRNAMGKVNKKELLKNVFNVN